MSVKPRCIKCQYYYITWEKVFPYGCKAMGFKSYRMPSTVVKESSGQECFAFVEKQQKKE
ncbi:uracil-DNA glycosylase [Sporomusa sp. KB1]|jgi:hypothetical protein|uniref:uracil-DNA glycosylase n=1 Tax=Sporomusa sp. KB1 TaxID=943346 RepID=UPI00119F9659|nr:uracil-DNA glycosylase [Sporomusa sp. KB1]TWH46255.1 hypothetical protein Salpa_2228 [Sporomusa sp. KB1]